jgi:peptidyl-tRNA hydrolase
MSCTYNTLNATGPGLVWGIRSRAMALGASCRYHKCGIKRKKTRRVACWVIKNDSQSEEREADKWLLEKNPSVPDFLSEKDMEKEMGRRYERSVRSIGEKTGISEKEP